MDEECESLLTGDLLRDCVNAGGAGLEINIVLINEQDINRTGTVISPTNKLLVTSLELNAGKTGYQLQGIKQINTSTWELVKKETSADKFRHVLNAVILSVNLETKTQIQKMSEGARLVAVIEVKAKGANNADAFVILGLNQGLELNVATWSSVENDGTIQFELSSTENFEEPTVPHTLLETDYATTKTAFNNKFAAA